MLHGFHHPKFSDIDFMVYGKKENCKMRKTLEALYADKAFGFDVTSLNQTKPWRARIGVSKTSLLKTLFGIRDENKSTAYMMIKPAAEP